MHPARYSSEVTPQPEGTRPAGHAWSAHNLPQLERGTDHIANGPKEWKSGASCRAASAPTALNEH